MEKTKETFDRTIGYLVQAYFNDTLESGDCPACAVGNICAGYLGRQVIPLGGRYNNMFTWTGSQSETATDVGNWSDVVWRLKFPKMWTPAGIAEVEATPYTPEELACIENAFMEYPDDDKDDTPEPTNFERLMNVVDVLIDIHGLDEVTKTEAKALFARS